MVRGQRPVPLLLAGSLLGLNRFLNGGGVGLGQRSSLELSGGQGRLQRVEAARLGWRELFDRPGLSPLPTFLAKHLWALEAAKGAYPGPSLLPLGASSFPASFLPLAAPLYPHPIWSSAAPSPACWRFPDPSLGGGGLLTRLDRSLHSLTCVIWELFIYS